MQLDKKTADYLLSVLAQNSRPGQAIADKIRVVPSVSGVDVVAIGYTCDRPNCNCNGGWWEGEQAGTEFKKEEIESYATT